MALKRERAIKIEGLKELDEALGEFPKATARNVLKRVAVKSLQPLITMARQLVPVRTGELRNSLKITTKLSKRQASIARREAAREGKSFYQTYAGPSALPYAHMVEFGTSKMKAQPYMRPAWDATKHQALDIISKELEKEINAAAARAAKKTARFAKKR
jgi:HK97 gp10 family phage protein